MTYMTINTIRIIYQYLTKSMCHVVSLLHHIHQIWPTLPTFFSHFTPAEVDAGRASSNSSQPFRLSASNAAQGRVMGMQCGTHRFSRWPFFVVSRCWTCFSSQMANDLYDLTGWCWKNPSEKYDFVSWDDYSQLNGKIKNGNQTTNQFMGGRSGLRMIICWICDLWYPHWQMCQQVYQAMDRMK